MDYDVAQFEMRGNTLVRYHNKCGITKAVVPDGIEASFYAFGGYDANGVNFGFANDYRASQDGTTAVYTNSFYTRVPLDGLTLPLEMEFDDALCDATAKLGIAIKLPSNFTPDGGTDDTMTLYKDERYTLIFKNWNLSKELIATDAPYELIFTENYTFTRESGRVSNVTRTIKLLFTPDENVLHEFGVMIQESYNLT